MAFEYTLTTKDPIMDKRRELYKDINFNEYFLSNQIELSPALLSYFDVTKEHYHFLGYISTTIDNGTIIDTGTHRGGSAIALSYNQSNKVHTYDIESFRSGITGNVKNIPKNISYYCPLSIIELMETNPDQILTSDIFFIDINHEGPEEIKLFDFLLENNYKGILILDDIHINADMEHVWSYIQSSDVITFDATNIAHLLDGDGTGVVFFDKSHQSIDKIQSIIKDVS